METSFFDRLLHAVPFPFKDPDWVTKLLIGSAILLAMFIVPIVPILIVTGYCKRIMARIINENGEPYLPEWTDWGGLLTDGLKLYGMDLVFTLPALLLMLVSMGLFMGAGFIPPLVYASGDSSSTAPIWIMVIAMFIGFALFLPAILIAMLTGLLQSPAHGYLVAKGSFSAAFQESPLNVKGSPTSTFGTAQQWQKGR